MAELEGKFDFGMIDAIQYFFEKNKFIDVVLVSAIDLVRISAHRVVLTACSSYFKDIFTAMEQDKSDILIVVLDDILGETLNSIIKCFYTGYLDINLDNLENLVAAAKTLNLPNITKACGAFIARNLNAENCTNLHSLTARHDMQNMRDVLRDYICDNFIKVYKSEAFLNMEKKYLSELLSSDDLTVDNEEDALDALLKWLQHDESRVQQICNLLNHIRIEHLNLKYLAEHMAIVKKIPQLQDLLNRAFEHQFAPKKSLGMTFRRPGRQTFVVINRNGIRKQIYKYCPREDECKQLMEVDIEQEYGFAICELNAHEFVIAGGQTDDEATNNVSSINLLTKSVNTLNPMNTSRTLHRLAVLNNCIYAIGGLGDYYTLKSVERTVQSNGVWSTWSYVSDMTVGRVNHAVATLEGLLYVVGGCNGYDLFNSVECYNPEKNEWRACASMIEKRKSHEVAVLNNNLYAIGGLSSGTTMEKYDPRIDKWTQVCKLNTKRSCFACVAMNERLIVLGGDDNSSVEEYNAELNVWNTKRSLPIANDHAGALLRNK